MSQCVSKSRFSCCKKRTFIKLAGKLTKWQWNLIGIKKSKFDIMKSKVFHLAVYKLGRLKYIYGPDSLLNRYNQESLHWSQRCYSVVLHHCKWEKYQACISIEVFIHCLSLLYLSSETHLFPSLKSTTSQVWFLCYLANLSKKREKCNGKITRTLLVQKGFPWLTSQEIWG